MMECLRYCSEYDAVLKVQPVNMMQCVRYSSEYDAILKLQH